MKAVKPGIIACLVFMVIGIFFRTYRLGSVPPSPSLDEVSIGYNAYSILKTGRDEYGTWFPLVLRAYDDYRPALYVYLVIPFVAVFGLTAAAVRAPSVLLSVGTLVLTYLVASQVARALRPKSARWVHYAPIASVALLAVSPWHVYLSRLGHEVNLGLTVILLAMYCFFRAVYSERERYFLIASAVLFSVSLLTYQSQKIVAPLLAVALGVIYWRQLISMRKTTILAVLFGLVLLVPILRLSLTSEALIRFRGTTAFNESNEFYRESVIKFADASAKGDIVGKLINHRWMATARIFAANYLLHFDWRWLFFGGEDERHKVPFMGLLYPLELPFILLGLFVMVRTKSDGKMKAVLLVWFLLAPVPASMTTETPHAMRSFTFIPLWQLFAGMGVAYFFELFRARRLLITVSILLLTLWIWGAASLYGNYFSVFPKVHAKSFQYALQEAIRFAMRNETAYGRVIISNKENLYQSYMFYLFLSRYDPEKYRQEGGTPSGGYAETHAVGRFEFRPISWDKEQISRQVLYLGNPWEIPNPKQIFANPDGQPAVVAAERYL